MNVNLQWRCKSDHKDCEAQEWRPYKTVTADEAKSFLENQAPNSTLFEYRVEPALQCEQEKGQR